MNEQEIIKNLTDLLSTIQGYYFKGRLEGCRPQVHEHSDSGASISIDLYNFGGDGEPVCDGLKPCTLTYDDGSHESGHLFCMCYDPDEVTPLIFLFTPEDDEDCTMDIDPEDVPEETLQNILAWLEAEWESNAKQEDKPDVKQLTAMMDRWAGFCYNHPPYEDVILWMVGGSKQHYLYQHFCSKFSHLCDVCHDDTMGAWMKFYRELDSKWAERLMQYVYCEWKKS